MKTSTTRLKSPLHLSISITNKCNLGCSYCYAKPLGEDYIKLDKLKQIFDEILELEVFQIKIGGGEPLLHPNIFEFLDYIIKKNTSVAILSGLFVDNELLDRFIKKILPHRNISFQVSLDSIDESVNDLTRGNGRIIKENIDKLIGYDIDFQIACVLSKYNINKALDIIDYYYPRVHRFHFMNLMPSLVLAKENKFHGMVAKKEDINNFWQILHQKRKSLWNNIRVTKTENDITECEQACEYAGCSAGVTSCDIEADLKVIACCMAKSKVLGSLEKNSIKNVWRSEEAKKIREMEIPLCYLNLNNNFTKGLR